jgi:DNA-binding NarL/FixJ family response regulator
VDNQAFLMSDNKNRSSGATLLQFTPMQMKILNGVRSGLLNKQIAFDLGIAEATVKAHMTAIMRKLNVTNRTQVALAAQVEPFRGVSLR